MTATTRKCWWRNYWNWAAALIAIGVSVWTLMRLSGVQPHAITDRSTTIEWDFSKGHEVTAVKWPVSASGNSFSIPGEVKTNIRLDKDHVFEGTAANLYCDKRNGHLQMVTIDLPPESLFNAYAHAKKMMLYWEIEDIAIDDWASRVTKGDSSTFTAVRRSSSECPVDIGLEIPPATGPFGTDWHIMLSFFWKK